MPRSDREDQILQFIHEQGIPLPPGVIYRGMRQRFFITYVQRTLSRMLDDLVQDGYLVRVDTAALDRGEIETLPTDTDQEGWYWITEKGRERIGADESSD